MKFFDLRARLLALIIIFFICSINTYSSVEDTLKLSNSITVFGKKNKETRSSANVVIISKKEIEGENLTLAEIINKEAGVKVRQFGGLGEYSSISIRGSSAEQVKVFMDGILINSSEGGGVDLSKISLLNVEKIELYKGNIPAEFQGSGTGGVVNIITVKDGKHSSTFTASYGSFNTQKLGAYTSGKLSKLSYMISYDRLYSDNNYKWIDPNKNTKVTLKVPDPTLDDIIREMKNNDFTSHSFLSKLSYPLPIGKLSLYLKSYNYNKGYFTIRSKPDSDTRLSGNKLTSRLTYSFLRENYILKISGAYSNKFQEFHDPDAIISLGAQELLENMNILNSNISLKIFPSTINTNFHLGIDVSYEDFTDTNSALQYQSIRPHAYRKTMLLSFSNKTNFLNNKLLFETAYTLDNRWSFADAEFSHGSYRTIEDKNSFDFYNNLSFSAMYKTTKNIQFKINSGYYTRVPNFFELYGNNAYYIGNNELLPELGLNNDFLVNIITDISKFINMSNTISVFFNRLEDQIVYHAESRYAAKALNMGDISIYGLEHTLKIKTKYFNLENQFSYTKSKITSIEKNADLYLGKERSYLPNFKNSFMLSKELFKTFLFNYNFDYRSSYYKGEYNLDIIPLSITHNLGTSLFILNKSLKIKFDVKNILNVNNYDVEDFPLPGRALYLNLLYKL